MNDVIMPKGVTQEEFNTAKQIIMSGFENGQTPDAIKTVMFKNNIKFSLIMRLYKHITVSEELVRDKSEVKKEVIDILLRENVGEEEIKSWDDVEQLLSIVENGVQGSNSKLTLKIMKTMMEENDLSLPNKPKSKKTSKNDKVINLVLDIFANNKEVTVEDFTKSIEPVTTEKSITKWVKQYKAFSALANGKSTL